MDEFSNIKINKEKEKMINKIKTKAIDLLTEFDFAVSPQERSEAGRLMNIARTNLEQTVMWANKAVSRIRM